MVMYCGNIKSIMIAFEYEICRFLLLTQTTSRPKTEVLTA